MSAGGIREVPGSSPAAGASGGGSGGGGSSGNLNTMAPLVRSSGTNYQPTSLGAQASTVLNQLARSAHSSAPPIPMAPTQSQASFSPNLRACLIRIGNGQHPLLVDLAHYLGHPALIVVLPSTNGAPPTAQVIAPGCTATGATILATAPLPHTG